MADTRIAQAVALLREHIDPNIAATVQRDRAFLIEIGHALGVDGDDPHQQVQIATLLHAMKITTLNEYPKWIHRDGKPSVIVNNADEEAALGSS